MAFLDVSPRRRLHGLPLALLLLGGSGCSEMEATGDTVPAQPGIQQPSGGGAAVDEVTACRRLEQALSGRRSELGCPAEAVTCPALVRPAAGACSYDYDGVTLEACVEAIGQYASCEDFHRHRCVVTAIERSGCSGGAGGAGGTSGAGGAGGAAGGGGLSGAAGANP